MILTLYSREWIDIFAHNLLCWRSTYTRLSVSVCSVFFRFSPYIFMSLSLSHSFSLSRSLSLSLSPYIYMYVRIHIKIFLLNLTPRCWKCYFWHILHTLHLSKSLVSNTIIYFMIIASCEMKILNFYIFFREILNLWFFLVVNNIN